MRSLGSATSIGGMRTMWTELVVLRWAFTSTTKAKIWDGGEMYTLKEILRVKP